MIGAFLRKTSIDELPQLFNVLKGEMSCRPRPCRFATMSYSKPSVAIGSASGSAFGRESRVLWQIKAGVPRRSKNGWSWICNTFGPGPCGSIWKFWLKPFLRF